MSEWQNMQKKPSTKLRDLLKTNPAKTRKLSELSKTEQNRLAKLNAMLDQLRRRKNVQNRQLATWLTEDEYDCFEGECESQKLIKEELKEKPKVLGLYEDKLKQAIFNYSRAEAYSTKRKNKTAQKFYRKSESFCESALEILQEIDHADSSIIHIWFDRGLDFEADGDLGLTPVAMPRLITSRSLEKQRSDSRLRSKRDIKIAVVEMAINKLLEVKTRHTGDKQKLAELIKLLDADDTN